MYNIFTDTSANLPQELLIENGIITVALAYCFEGEEENDNFSDSFDGESFYDELRHGKRVITSQVTSQKYIDSFKPVLESGNDILFIGISSGISGSHSSAQMAAADLREQFPEREIHIIDTLSASLGEGLLVKKAIEHKNDGMSIKENAEALLSMRHLMCQVFSVDDLKFLQRTGRLTGFQTIIGTVLNIKPILIGNPEGKIICISRIRSRKRAIKALAEQYDKWVISPETQTIGIAHADCLNDAEYLINLIRENKPPKEILNVCYEPVTGAHVGPGTLALFFLGDGEFRKQ